MENLTHAMYLAFAMLGFVVAFTVSLLLINQLNATTETIVFKLNGSYFDSFSLNSLIEDNEDKNRSRIVGVDSIIPTLYRYYKESFAVKILDVDGTLLQYFDTTTEWDVNDAKSAVEDETVGGTYIPDSEIVERNKQKALLSLYDDSERACYMAGAPWLANINKDAKTRVDMYISGGKGFIHDVLVDYSVERGGKIVYLNNYKDRKFKETFTQYAYEGDTVTDEEDELVTLTGSKQISTKIIIIYQLLP